MMARVPRRQATLHRHDRERANPVFDDTLASACVRVITAQLEPALERLAAELALV